MSIICTISEIRISKQYIVINFNFMQFFKSKFSFVVHKTFWEKKMARKEKRRFKGLNVYIPEFTGEGAIH